MAIWILGQGTIYPDTIESGGTEKAAVIKTHHNRVPGIQTPDRRRPPSGTADVAYYKDEVREIGRELGFPRSPRPPSVSRTGLGHPLPLFGNRRRFTGHRRGLDCARPLGGSAGRQPELRAGVVYRRTGSRPRYGADQSHLRREPGDRARVRTAVPLAEMRVRASALTSERLARLRHADAIVRRFSHESGFDRRIWQFPVVLIPLGTAGAPDSVVLRPIDSVDGMTAQSVAMPDDLLESISTELLAVPGISGVFYDLTHKPPATIEWE